MQDRLPLVLEVDERALGPRSGRALGKHRRDGFDTMQAAADPRTHRVAKPRI
jgi:hypothetical protein